MIANQIYNIELPSDESFLSSSENMLIVASIFQQAISKYLETYSRKEIPLSFFKFYFNEIKNYSYMFRKQTKEFFETYDRIGPNFDVIAEIYNSSFFSQTDIITKSNDEKFLVLKKLNVIDYFEEMSQNSNKNTESAIQNIKKITEHINESDELITFGKKYENYMISEIVRKTEFKDKYSGKSKVILNVINNDEKTQIISATKRAERLTSERINISSKKGKVTKIIIPKLKLPSAYPKSEFHRFNSKYHANNIVSASRQILILSDLKINGIAYSTTFVDKRKYVNDL